MNTYVKLLRVKHYIKNLIIFVPMFFGGFFFDRDRMKCGIWGFLIFCMTSSAVYILNDLRDLENDRMHPQKRNRPLASGKIKQYQGKLVMFLCICGACVLQIALTKSVAAFTLWGGILFTKCCL